MHALGRSIPTGGGQEEVMNKQDIVLRGCHSPGAWPGHLLGCDDLEEKVLMSRWTGRRWPGIVLLPKHSGASLSSHPQTFGVASIALWHQLRD